MKSHPLRCDWMASMTNGHEFEQALGVGDGQGSLVCCSPWGCKEWGTNKRLNCIDYHGDNLEKKCFSIFRFIICYVLLEFPWWLRWCRILLQSMILAFNI